MIKYAIIGGSGLDETQTAVIPASTEETPYGKTSSSIMFFEQNNSNAAFIARHGIPHHIPPHRVNYRANLWALKQLGVQSILAVNAVGAISEQFEEGALIVPNQLIDYTCGREHSFCEGEGNTPLDHIDFTQPYTETFRQQVLSAARSLNLKIYSQAVYGVTQGPRLETAAEIKRMASDGCDLVGMTAMPEAALARELSVDYASVCVVVNPAAGMGNTELSMEKIHQALKTGMHDVRRLINYWLSTCSD